MDSAVNTPSVATVRDGSGRLLRIAASLVIVLVVIIFGFWYWVPPELHGVLLQSPRPATDFTLLTSNGTEMSLSDFRGKFVLLYLGYTYCPDVCPTTLNDLASMAEELGERRMNNVQVIFITVDPERDTSEHLASYLPHFHPSFLGMTGSIETIQSVASQFGIYFEKQPGTLESGYLMDHTSAVTVVGPQGNVRMVFPNGTSGADMAADLTYLMRR